MGEMVASMHDLAVMPPSQLHDGSPGRHVVCAGVFTAHEGYAVRRRTGCPSWLALYTVEGTGDITGGTSSFVTRPGDLVLLQPDRPHEYACRDRWTMFWTHFQPRVEWTSLLQLPRRADGVLGLSMPESVRPRIESVVLRAVADASGTTFGYQHLRELLTNAIEELLLIAASVPVDAVDPRVRDVLSVMTAELDRAHTLASLANRVRLSPSRLEHLFTEQTGRPIGRTLLDLRLQQAARLLERTSMAVREVATAVGFSCAFHFSRQFSRAYGLPPTAFREGQRG